MDEKPRFAGHRLIRFAPASKATLREIAERLIPHQQEILQRWVSRQFESWRPPGFSQEGLTEAFGGLLSSIFNCMHSGQLELCIDELGQAGRHLADLQFPFDALVISVHFLEASYMPFLLNPPPPNQREWLVNIDEFLHVAIASISNSYFEAYRRELLDQAEVGRIVQEGLLADIPRKAADLEIAHIYISARERAQLGGDFLDSFVVEPDKVAFLIGDLSGHGLEAAADSVMLRSLYRGFMRENPDPADAMARLNNVLTTELKGGLFATALSAVYDSSGEMRLVSAGHPYPVICDSSGNCRLVETSGMALAIRRETDYTPVNIFLEPGSVFIAYTDGLTEARSGADMFGEEKIIKIAGELRDASARAIVEHLVDEAQRHAGGKLTDDVAILVLKRHTIKKAGNGIPAFKFIPIKRCLRDRF